MGLTVNSMRPLKIVGFIFIIGRFSRTTECLGILISKEYMAGEPVSDLVFRLQIKIIPPIRIYIGRKFNIKIITQDFVITDSIQSQSILGTYIKSRCQKTRMSACRDREI